jgi:maltoporin
MKKFTLGILSLLLLTGCANHINSKINSLASPAAISKLHFFIVPGNKGVSSYDLQFQEFSTYVKQALIDRGFKQASSMDKADIAIFLSYGIGTPETHFYSYKLPIYGQTKIPSSNTKGAIFSPDKNQSMYSSSTSYTPSYGITGYTTQIASYTTYTRFLILDAYETKSLLNEKKMIQVWKTVVTSIGDSEDLRYIFPYMVCSMKPYMATNTLPTIVKTPTDDYKIL